MSKEYWIWLQQCLGFKARVDEITAYFGSAEDLYKAGSMEWRLSGIFTPKQIYKLTSIGLSVSEDIINECNHNGWHMITPQDEYYPSKLLEIPDFPCVLYVWGDPEILKCQVPIAIVGTRNASQYGAKVARHVSASLAQVGAVVVSGGALGIDSHAHLGALSVGGKTVAVLGCGLGTDYLRENSSLRNDISNNGAVITEFPPRHTADRTTFPIRNRIISGMSLGTVVIEAGERSGSLITARMAAEQGRDVFAVPGNAISSAFTGAHKLIRDGAKPVFSGLDVIEEYLYYYPDTLNLKNLTSNISDIELSDEKIVNWKNKATEKKKTTEKREQEPQLVSKQPLPDGISEEAKKIYALFESDSIHIDELISITGFNSAQTLSALTELELYGIVKLLEGRRYILG